MIDDEPLPAGAEEALAAIDPVPEWVKDAALAAFATRRQDAGLVELATDSTDSAEAVPAGIRGRHDPRLLVFTGPDVVVELEVTGDGAAREIAGRLAPATPADIAVRHGSGQVAARADGTGHFVISAVPAGPISLLFVLADASSIVTSWVRL
jgi:hypothetical protein